LIRHRLPGCALTYGCFHTVPAYPFAIDALELCSHGRLFASGARFRRFDPGLGRQFHLHRFNGKELIIRHFQNIKAPLNVKLMKSLLLILPPLSFYSLKKNATNDGLRGVF
jgi:hypothetical protein